ncbi:MAG: NfeD family protein [Planctomycetaceae bacterium]
MRRDAEASASCRRPWAGVLAAAIACGTAVAADVAAVLVPVRLPITGTRDTQVEAAVLRQLDRLKADPARRGVIVLEFTAAGDDPVAESDFGRSLELARFLAGERLAGVKTVAFLPAGATGHAVLVALACEEIVMPADAVLGPAGVAEPAIDDAMRAAYAQIAARRRTVPPAVAVALVDPAARVARVATEAGERFVAPAEVPRLRESTAVIGVEELEPAPLEITGRRGREFGFVRLLAGSAADLARGLDLDPAALAADPSRDGGWRPALAALDGGITAEAVGRVRSRLDRAVADGANLIVLRIDSAGGAPEQSLVLATWLAGLDPGRVRTVAWIPREARGDAALVAAACDEIVMEPAAMLGGEGAASLADRQAESVAAAWKAGVARPRERSWSLPLALALPGIAVQRAVQRSTGRVEFLAPEELAARADRDAWELGAPLGAAPLRLDARRAEEVGLAAHVVDGLAGLRAAYGIDAAVALPQPGWAEELLAALASPSLAWLLLLIGGAGLYIELKTPGFGFGGFVAMVAFIVYFWSQYLHGTSGWLEVMLFLAGIVCVAAEILVLPGFGVLGLGGGLLVIASIVLASQSFVLPTNDWQIRQMQWSLLGILGAVVGVAALGAALRRWLPSTPVLRHVLLEPPPEEPAFDDDALADLVGIEGMTTTRLAPCGKALVAGAVRDVTTEGALVEPGTAVRVVEVRGGRVYVRQVRG